MKLSELEDSIIRVFCHKAAPWRGQKVKNVSTMHLKSALILRCTGKIVAFIETGRTLKVAKIARKVLFGEIMKIDALKVR